MTTTHTMKHNGKTYTLSITGCGSIKRIDANIIRDAAGLSSKVANRFATFYVTADDADQVARMASDSIVAVCTYLLTTDVFTIAHMRATLDA